MIFDPDIIRITKNKLSFILFLFLFFNFYFELGFSMISQVTIINFLSNISSRSVFLVSRASSRLYHEKMMINNNLPDKKIVKPINRSQLSYSGDSQRRNCVSIVTNPILL